MIVRFAGSYHVVRTLSDRSQKGGDAGDFFANLRRLATVTSIKVLMVLVEAVVCALLYCRLSGECLTTYPPVIS